MTKNCNNKKKDKKEQKGLLTGEIKIAFYYQKNSNF